MVRFVLAESCWCGVIVAGAQVPQPTSYKLLEATITRFTELRNCHYLHLCITCGVQQTEAAINSPKEQRSRQCTILLIINCKLDYYY